MNAKQLLVIGAIMLASVSAILVFKPDHSISKTAKTMGLIRQCELYESGKLDLGLKPQDVSGYLHSNEMDGLSLGQIFAAMYKCPTCIPERIVTIKDVQDITNTVSMNDAWGNPLNFAWHAEAVKSNVCETLLVKNLPVLIWSSGPNGSNEFGSGDDVFVGKELVK